MHVVKIPMMPKGVEHPYTAEGISPELQVKIPMMPKGVEHSGTTPFGIIVDRGIFASFSRFQKATA